MINNILKWSYQYIGGALLLLVFLISCASMPKQLDISTLPIYDISAAPDAQLIDKYLDEQKHKDPFIIKIPKGYALPVRLEIDTPLAKLDSDAGDLQFTQDLYIYLDNREVLASPDAKRWAPFSDMEMVKELFGGDQGSVSLGVGAKEIEGARLTVKVRMTSAKKNLTN